VGHGWSRCAVGTVAECIAITTLQRDVCDQWNERGERAETSVLILDEWFDVIHTRLGMHWQPLSPRGDADGSGKTAVNPADDDLSMPSLPAARPKPRLLTQIVRHLKNSSSGDNVHVVRRFSIC